MSIQPRLQQGGSRSIAPSALKKYVIFFYFAIVLLLFFMLLSSLTRCVPDVYVSMCICLQIYLPFTIKCFLPSSTSILADHIDDSNTKINDNLRCQCLSNLSQEKQWIIRSQPPYAKNLTAVNYLRMQLMASELIQDHKSFLISQDICAYLSWLRVD